jgi:alpha-mannosidase
VYPHGGGWKEALTVRQGYDLNYKLVSIPTGKHEGALAAEHSFVEAEADNVIVSAVKKAEDDGSLILRFYEWAGKTGDVKLQIPPGATSASEADLMERPEESVRLEGQTVSIPIKPYEIKTIKVQYGSMTANGAAQP